MKATLIFFVGVFHRLRMTVYDSEKSKKMSLYGLLGF